MAENAVPEIENPRRVLAVSLEGESHHLGRVVKDLSGTHPTPNPTLSGTTHPLPLSTPYYKTTLPLWLDLIDDPASWSSTFLSPEAKEVLDALGGLLIVFEIPPASTSPPSAAQGRGAGEAGKLIEAVGRVVQEGLGGWGWDGVVVAVGIGRDDEGEWEERCAEGGMELVVLTGKEVEGTRNEFGEKVGIARVTEALQSNDWASLPNEDDDPELDLDGLDLGSDSELDFGLGSPSDFEGLRQAILEASLEREGVDVSGGRGEGSKGEGAGEKKAEGGGMAGEDIGEEDVRKTEMLMGKLLAVREMGEGMSEGERRRMARRAVGEVMKEL